MVRRLVVEMWDVKGKCEYSECIASDSQQVVVLEVGRVLITALYKIV
jgi:hypothetical protein